IPIIVNESTTCNIPKNSHLAALIRSTDLIIWDKAPMQHRHLHEAVDRSFQDICSDNRLFGGIPIVFGGDFQQILPVIERGSRAQTVGACMQHSLLWHSIKVLLLIQNMHLNTNDPAE